MEIEIFVDAVQHEPVGAGRRRRRLTPAEVHERARSFRANWLARELGDPSQERHVAHVLTTDPDLAAALEPRELDDDSIGIVVDDKILKRLRAAISAR